MNNEIISMNLAPNEMSKEVDVHKLKEAMHTIVNMFSMMLQRGINQTELEIAAHKRSDGRIKDSEINEQCVPVSERLLLNFKEAAMLLSMSEASLRDLVHRGEGPENVRRGKRVCFTQEGLKKYVDGLPREYPYQDIIETINAKGSRPATIEERRAFGV